MVSTVALLSLVVIVALTLVVIRVGTVALMMTGLSRDVAQFQALSAFSGAGFTTTEAEQMMASPERRAIIKNLIRLGSLGVITAIGSLVVSFAGAENAGFEEYVLVGIGCLVLYIAARSKMLDAILTPVIQTLLAQTTSLELRDYTELLGLQGEFGVAEVLVEEGEWLCGKEIQSLRLPAEGVLVLGIERADGYVGAPPPELEIRDGDTLVAYGPRERLVELSERSSSDWKARQDAVAEFESEREAQERLAEKLEEQREETDDDGRYSDD